jgi:probable F420-dependent oxidoreductase
MQFSLALTPYSRFPALADLLAAVGLAERLGFWSVHFGEHMIGKYGASVDDSSAYGAGGQEVVSPLYYDQQILAAAILSRHARIRVLLNVLVLPYHRPIQLAKTLATLDVLGEGRLSVGVGVGWQPDEFEALQIPIGERGAITDEYIAAMQAIWRDSPATFEGRYVSFRDIVCEPRPVRNGQPNLWIGAGRSARGIERAIRFGASGITFQAHPHDALRGRVEAARSALGQHKCDLDSLAFAYTMDYAREDPDMTVHYVAGDGMAHAVLSAHPSYALEQIAGYQELGFTHLFIRVAPDKDTGEDFTAKLTRFGEEIMRPLGISSAS